MRYSIPCIRYVWFIVRANNYLCRMDMLSRMRDESFNRNFRGHLSDEEAQEILFSTYLFRHINRASTFARFHFLNNQFGKVIGEDGHGWREVLNTTYVDAVEIQYNCRGSEHFGLAPNGANLPTAGCIRLSEVTSFNAYCDACREVNIKLFTGEHISAHWPDVRINIEHLEKNIAEFTTSIRKCDTPFEVFSILMGLEGVGKFFAFQVSDILLAIVLHDRRSTLTIC